MTRLDGDPHLLTAVPETYDNGHRDIFHASHPYRFQAHRPKTAKPKEYGTSIIETAILTDVQKCEVQTLQTICNACDALHSETMLTNKFNLDKKMPCFFLGYDDDSPVTENPTEQHDLTAFLYLFFVEPSTIEITAFTAPTTRRRGWFTRLYQTALPHIRRTSANTVLFQIEPDSGSGMATLRRRFADATLSHSEYQLSCVTPPARDIAPLRLEKVTQRNKETEIHLAIEIFQRNEAAERSHIESILNEDGNDAFIVYDGNHAVGLCNRVLEDDSAGLFSLGVRPSLRYLGYGKRLLASMLRQSLQERPKVTLEVDSHNPPALNLYLHNGFTIDFQMDYHAIPIV